MPIKILNTGDRKRCIKFSGDNLDLHSVLKFLACFVFSHQISQCQKGRGVTVFWDFLFMFFSSGISKNMKQFPYVYSFVLYLVSSSSSCWLYIFESSPTVSHTSDVSLSIRLITKDSIAQRYGTLQFETSKFELTKCNKNCTFLPIPLF